MSALTRQQLCAQLGVSESTVKKLEREGMPTVAQPWSRRKAYDLVACRLWLNQRSPGVIGPPPMSRRFYGGNARARTLKRMPAWADKAAIKAIYEKAHRRTWESGVPHHVDHVLPLQGEFVSGFHVHNNLQILTGADNGRKGNHFEVAP